jgi:hypothetical protein
MRAEGSPTAGLGTRIAAGTGIAGTVVAILSNPFATAPIALKTGGVAWVLQRASRSLIGGIAGQRISRMGQGIPPQGLRSLPAALQSRGGFSGVGRDVQGLIPDVTGLVGSGLQAIVGNRGPQGRTQ